MIKKNQQQQNKTKKPPQTLGERLVVVIHIFFLLKMLKKYKKPHDIGMHFLFFFETVFGIIRTILAWNVDFFS